MFQRFEPPGVSLKSYGGGWLDVVAQIPVWLTRATCSTIAIVLVQKGGPNELLLGTDTLSSLGFSLMMMK